MATKPVEVSVNQIIKSDCFLGCQSACAGRTKIFLKSGVDVSVPDFLIDRPDFLSVGEIIDTSKDDRVFLAGHPACVFHCHERSGRGFLTDLKSFLVDKTQFCRQ